MTLDGTSTERKKKKKKIIPKIIQIFSHLKMFGNRNNFSLWSDSRAKPELSSEDQILCWWPKTTSVRIKHKDLTFKQLKSLLTSSHPKQLFVTFPRAKPGPTHSHCMGTIENCSRNLQYLGAGLLHQKSHCSPTVGPRK